MASPVRIFFRYAFALTWGVGLIGLIVARMVPGTQTFSTTSPFYWIAGYAISLLGIAMTAAWDGPPGLRRLGSRLVPWRTQLHWYLIVLGGYGLIFAVALHAARAVGAGPSSLPGLRAVLLGIVLTLATDVGPLGEEFGWRGFALPRLLEQWPPLTASLILGAMHAVWHIPLFFIPGMPQNHIAFPMFAVGVISIAIIDTWLYLRTDANLLLAILVHLMANYCGGIVGASALPFFFAGEGVAALTIVALGGLRPPGSIAAHAAGSGEGSL
jgi:membrane protease YdiL (CAAX protease family)